MFEKKSYEFSADKARELSSLGEAAFEELLRKEYMERRDNLLSHIFDVIKASACLGGHTADVQKITYLGEDVWEYATHRDLCDILKYDTEYFEKLGYHIEGYKLGGRSYYYGLTVSWEKCVEDDK